MPWSELDSLRAAMDVLNRRLVDVLHERARLCRRIAHCKLASGRPAADPAREQAMLQALLSVPAGEGFPPESLALILRTVFAESRQLVERSTGC
ncbi:MAG: chorismate mutase [Planctomycetes bacterium]|nr:chorismate mutase [Planctomycetota bacterium]